MTYFAGKNTVPADAAEGNCLVEYHQSRGHERQSLYLALSQKINKQDPYPNKP